MAHLPNGVWIPDSVARNYTDQRGEHNAELDRVLESGTHTTLDEWNRILAQIDPELRMVRAKENTSLPGLTPGYYHVVRRNELGPPTLIPLEGPHGEFREPGSWVLDVLGKADLWSNQARSERERRERELERQTERRKEREREERHEEIYDRLKAYNNPGVSMTGQGRGWSYRAKKAA